MADGEVVALWRYPVKSMLGEELNASEVTDWATAAESATPISPRSVRTSSRSWAKFISRSERYSSPSVSRCNRLPPLGHTLCAACRPFPTIEGPRTKIGVMKDAACRLPQRSTSSDTSE